METGWIPVSLGESLLRTETAALYAIMMMRMVGRKDINVVKEGQED